MFCAFARNNLLYYVSVLNTRRVSFTKTKNQNYTCIHIVNGCDAKWRPEVSENKMYEKKLQLVSCFKFKT